MMNCDVWGPVDIARWLSLPSIQGRTAIEDDVKHGRAVFFVPVGIDFASSQPVNLGLPRPAIIQQSNEPVFVVQAEQVNGRIAIGYRPLKGGNGICMLEELLLLEEPNDLFNPSAD